MNPLQQLQEDAVSYLLGNPATANVGYESFRRQAFPGRTAQPSIADDDAGNVTLACIDGAAGIFYTLDGSMPQPGDTSDAGATKVYSAPFTVLSGTVVRCLAWNPALLPSDVDQATINF